MSKNSSQHNHMDFTHEEAELMSHERIAALESSHKRANQKIEENPKKARTFRHGLFLAGWFLGAMASDFLPGQGGRLNLDAYSIAIKLTAGVLGLAVSRTNILSVLPPYQTDLPVPWWFVLAQGVATGLLGRLIAERIS